MAATAWRIIHVVGGMESLAARKILPLSVKIGLIAFCLIHLSHFALSISIRARADANRHLRMAYPVSATAYGLDKDVGFHPCTRYSDG